MRATAAVVGMLSSAACGIDFAEPVVTPPAVGGLPTTVVLTLNYSDSFSDSATVRATVLLGTDADTTVHRVLDSSLVVDGRVITPAAARGAVVDYNARIPVAMPSSGSWDLAVRLPRIGGPSSQLRNFTVSLPRRAGRDTVAAEPNSDLELPVEPPSAYSGPQGDVAQQWLFRVGASTASLTLSAAGPPPATLGIPSTVLEAATGMEARALLDHFWQVSVEGAGLTVRLAHRAVLQWVIPLSGATPGGTFARHNGTRR